MFVAPVSVLVCLCHCDACVISCHRFELVVVDLIIVMFRSSRLSVAGMDTYMGLLGQATGSHRSGAVSH